MSYLRNHKLLLLVISVLLISNIGLLWFYVWNKPTHPDKTPPKGPDARTRMISEVGLNDQQIAIYDSLRKNHYETIGPMFKDLRHERDSLFKLMHQPELPDSLIEMQSSIVYKKQQAIDVKMHRYFRSVRDLCTAEQKPKMDTFLVNLAKKMNSGRRWGGGDKKDKK